MSPQEVSTIANSSIPRRHAAAVPNNSLYRNRLLGLLDQQDRALLAPPLQQVKLALRDGLEQHGLPIMFVYFIEQGLGSMVFEMAPGRDAEIGVLGILELTQPF